MNGRSRSDESLRLFCWVNAIRDGVKLGAVGRQFGVSDAQIRKLFDAS